MNYLKKLDPDMDLNDYFDSGDFSTLEIGFLQVSSGRLIAADPLCNLEFGDIVPFIKKVPDGRYPVTLSVFAEEGYAVRYLAAKLSVTHAEPVRFQLAMKPGEYAESLGQQEIFGFPVGSGLACLCDADTQEAYADFCACWKEQNPEGNIYDGYFAECFADNAVRNPMYQQQEGDWLNWRLPDGSGNILFFNSGFGDGVYPSYWGYDERGKICCLVLQFISPAELE